MKFACAKCGTKYTIPDEKVRGKVLRIRCKKCSNVMRVREPRKAAEPAAAAAAASASPAAAAQAPAPAAPAPAAAVAPPPPKPAATEDDQTPVWFLASRGKHNGPFTRKQVAEKLQQGEIHERTYVWRESFDGWKRLREVDALSDLLPEGGKALTAEVGRLAEVKKARQDQAPGGGADLSPTADLSAGSDDDFDEEDDQAAATVAMDASKVADLASMVAAEVQGPAASAGPAGGLADREDELFGDVSEPGASAAPAADPSASSPLNIPQLNVGAGAGPSLGAPPISNFDAATAPGEQTRFFMVQAGVDAGSKRRSALRRTALIILLIATTAGAMVYAFMNNDTFRGFVGMEPKEPAEKVVSLDQIPKDSPLRRLLLGEKDPEKAKAKALKKKKKRKRRRPKPKKEKIPTIPDIGGEDLVKDAFEGIKMEDADPESASARRRGSLDDLGAPASAKLGNPGSIASLGGKRATLDLKKKEAAVSSKEKAVDVDDPNLPDSLSGGQISRVVQMNQGGIKACYDQALKREPNLHGKVVVAVTITGGKGVTGVDVKTKKFKKSNVARCLSNKIKQWRFPRFRGEQTVEIPFVLSASY